MGKGTGLHWVRGFGKGRGRNSGTGRGGGLGSGRARGKGSGKGQVSGTIWSKHCKYRSRYRTPGTSHNDYESISNGRGTGLEGVSLMTEQGHTLRACTRCAGMCSTCLHLLPAIELISPGRSCPASFIRFLILVSGWKTSLAWRRCSCTTCELSLTYLQWSLKEWSCLHVLHMSRQWQHLPR